MAAEVLLKIRQGTFAAPPEEALPDRKLLAGRNEITRPAQLTA
jgi:hypothetical protein